MSGRMDAMKRCINASRRNQVSIGRVVNQGCLASREEELPGRAIQGIGCSDRHRGLTKLSELSGPALPGAQLG